MRLILLAAILFAGIGCDKTIHEARLAPANQLLVPPVPTGQTDHGPRAPVNALATIS